MIEFLVSEGNVWRCEPCSTNRRLSLRFETSLTEGKLTLEDLMAAIKDIGKKMEETNKDVNRAYEALNEKVDENTKTIQEQTRNLESHIQNIDKILAENKYLKEKISSLESRLEEAEQYSRKNCIEIHGLPIKNNDVIGAVIKVGKALGVDLNENMIDACHTLGNRSNAPGPPPIIAKLVRRIDAEKLLIQRRKKKDFSTRHLGLPDDSPIYVNESLSPARRRLLAKAREMRRQNNYKWLWVRGGKVLLKKEDNSPTIVLRCEDDLNNL